ncbi:glucosamine 6-phosphate synthetase [Malaciobacter halophilus]|uniref:glutamine--fructose-6-phosphate transaminase (isomerizing) n=1 Tax=Malaciobacter halophilus TaxID=197482 RepID=A0A2N1J5L0_9BACT|nr:glucosamine 6-phosphate synthetase [Malaciobacter halophilus]AXH09214.1 N-acetyl sugar amidotransferase [Malaciobacter halophilus]PKI81850.1 glucosamine 6-phosphate synthetase [Malaciobacter halophilus]
MCGIFGQISKIKVNKENLNSLVKHSEQRGIDSSGLIYYEDSVYKIGRADYNIEKLLKKEKLFNSKIVLGHSRLITNGLGDNQPVVRNNICAIHNGIIVNEKDIWEKLSVERKYQIDSEVIVAISEEHLLQNHEVSELPNKILSLCRGVVACALVLPEYGKLLLFSNNGSLYVGYIGDDIYFASERYALDQIQCIDVHQIKEESLIIDIPKAEKKLHITDEKIRNENLIPEFQFNKNEEKLLEFKSFKEVNLKRCTKCILPETMPFIKFDNEGVCNYCHNYKKRNKPKPKEELFKLVEPYRKPGKELDCIVPFSGGRDSCYGLHLIVKELEMKPVTYTYDWGMVTDLGRRNISQMCGDMGVENIIVAADISQKRKNIKMNLEAWLKSPHLGMMAMLTAGDKHFFRYVEEIKKQTGINLNLWGVNPLEQTHFKTGFLGIKPDFEEDKVYTNGVMKQLRYHSKRFKAMLESPGYFNSSLWDTLSGEYYRSFMQKEDYYHIFDYWTWEENLLNNTLINQYDWETAIDTSTTWRIGDGTAGFYNYVYYTVAGFTEHDTFRSNQIREGQLTREKALELVEDENQPRYQNIRWYLDTLGMDFEEVIKIVNSIPKLYNEN